jgi:hypothetical protein
MTLTTRSRCRDCGLSILWAELADGAKRPLDSNPVAGEKGLYYLSDQKEGLPLACYVRLEDRPKYRALYAAHFCPDGPRQKILGLDSEEVHSMKK